MRLPRAGLVILALVQVQIGLWALLAPQSFYDDFPGGGRMWVSPLGPFDEHALRDVGSLSLALVALLAYAAWTLEDRIVRLAGVAWLLWALPHLAYHLTADGALSRGDRIASEGGQAVTIAIALYLLLHRRRTPEVPK